MSLIATVKHHSSQNRKRQLARDHRFLLGYCDAGSGTDLPRDLARFAKYSRDTSQGFVRSYQALAVCRAILGFCGAGKGNLVYDDLAHADIAQASSQVVCIWSPAGMSGTRFKNGTDN